MKPNSVELVQDSFAVNHIIPDVRNNPLHHVSIMGVLSAASSGDRFARDALRKIRAEHLTRGQQYFSLVKRCLVPGGRFFLLTDAAVGPTYHGELKKAGFRLTTKRVISKQIARSLGATTAERWLGAGQQLYMIVVKKPGMRNR